jgi:hypothetical protein
MILVLPGLIVVVSLSSEVSSRVVVELVVRVVVAAVVVGTLGNHLKVVQVLELLEQARALVQVSVLLGVEKLVPHSPAWSWWVKTSVSSGWCPRLPGRPVA